MSFSELKKPLLIQELAKVGFPNAQYFPESDSIKVAPDSERPPEIYENGDMRYGKDFSDVVRSIVKPVVDRVNEVVRAWDRAAPVESVPNFRSLSEYNGIVLAARDDTAKGYGMHFVTWRYNQEHTAVEHGHYTTDYNAAKQDYAIRAGLIHQDKVFTREQATEIKAAVDFCINNDVDLSIESEDGLRSISEQLRAAYLKIDDDVYNRMGRESTKKPSMLAKLEVPPKPEKPPASKRKNRLER